MWTVTLAVCFHPIDKCMTAKDILSMTRARMSGREEEANKEKESKGKDQGGGGGGGGGASEEKASGPGLHLKGVPQALIDKVRGCPPLSWED